MSKFNHSKHLVSACLLIVSLFAGCSRENAGTEPSFSPRYEASTPLREIQETIFSYQMAQAIDDVQNPAVLGQLLVASMEQNNQESSDNDYFSRLLKLDKDQIIEAAGFVVGNKQAPARLALDSVDILGSVPSALDLLQLIERAKSNLRTLSLDAAQIKFEKALFPFQKNILNHVHKSYQELEASGYRKKVDRIIDVGLGKAKVKINASVGEMAEDLPKDLRMFTDIRDLLKILDQESGKNSKTDVSRVISRLARFSNEDIKVTRENVRELVSKSELSADEKLSQYSSAIRKVDAAIGLGGIIVGKILDKPEEARKLVTIATGVMKIIKTSSDFNVGKIGAQLATGDMVGAVADVLGGLLASGPTIEESRHQQVMEALEMIRMDIAQFSAEVSRRFDAVDSKLSIISNDLSTLLQEVGKANASLADIQSQVTALSMKVDTVALMMLLGLNDIMDLQFSRDYSQCLGLLSQTAQQVATTEAYVLGCLDAFQQRAYVSSRTPTRTGKLLPGASAEEKLRILAEAPTELALAPLMAMVKEYTGSRTAYEVINPKDFVMGAQSYLEMSRIHYKMLSTSPQAKKARAQAVEQMAALGRSFREALAFMGQTDVIERLLSVYETELYGYMGDLDARRIAEIQLMREMLDQIFRITRSTERFSDLRLLSLFSGEGKGFFTPTELRSFGTECASLEESPDALEPKKTAFRARALQSIALMRSVIFDLKVRGESRPPRSMVDDTLEKIPAFVALKE
ncbi:MAG: hypothetical protein A2X94_12665 [Bdellovibrionales bacterium GWB1_55_8]|nr:MAG: hypothetical protein A2X94_12665 [Bdellovibrionales bacterium GWB1_55_8]